MYFDIKISSGFHKDTLLGPEKKRFVSGHWVLQKVMLWRYFLKYFFNFFFSKHED